MPGPAPLREPTYFILAALLDQPRHGYAVADEVEAMSKGRVRLTAGTLYGALDRLLTEGLVLVDREETVQGRRRRYYRLSDDGRERLALEVERMEQAVAAAGAKLRGARRRSASKAATA
ncbi:MAG TPA: PadR family transcriptional regulator [Marmoricola sp.]|nr:PadR family transcriptional regulator [Marmoricola sp.]